MWTSTSRSSMVSPSCIVARMPRSGSRRRTPPRMRPRHAGLPRVVYDRLVGDRAEPVSVRQLLGPVQRRCVGVRHHPAEPVAFDIGHVADEAKQGHGRGRYRSAGELRGVQVRALHLHRQPVGAQVVKQRRPFAFQFHARSEPRVLRLQPSTRRSRRSGHSTVPGRSRGLCSQSRRSPGAPTGKGNARTSSLPMQAGGAYC